MLSVLGIGGAGGNIADYASDKGLPTGVINFSQKDLDSVDSVDAKLKLMGSEGVGHNRDEAINLMDRNWESAVRFVEEHFSNPSIDVVLVAFSCGGGSGSGISPILLELLSNTMDKTFVALPIIPDKTEVVVNQLNTIQTFEELSKLDISVFPIDNEKFRSSSMGKNKLFESVNSSVIDLFDKVLNYTEKHSKNGNLDKKDLMTILNTRGIGIISETDITNLTLNESTDVTEQGVTNRIQESWKKNVFARIEYDQVIRSGLIFDGQEHLMSSLNYSSIFGKFNNGMPIDLFEGNYHEQKGKVLSILTGLAWCKSRLSEIDEIVSEKQEKVESVLNNSNNQSYQSKVSTNLTSVIRKPKKPTKKQSVTDILNKYRR